MTCPRVSAPSSASLARARLSLPRASWGLQKPRAQQQGWTPQPFRLIGTAQLSPFPSPATPCSGLSPTPASPLCLPHPTGSPENRELCYYRHCHDPLLGSWLLLQSTRGHVRLSRGPQGQRKGCRLSAGVEVPNVPREGGQWLRAYYVPDMVFGTSQASRAILITTLCGCYNYPHFIDEETEAQRKDIIYQTHTVSGQCEI